MNGAGDHGPIQTSTLEQQRVHCPACGSNNVEASLVRTAFWKGERLMVIENLPALVCRACHEQFVDDATSMVLGLLRDSSFPTDHPNRIMSVPVVAFADLLSTVRVRNQEASDTW